MIARQEFKAWIENTKKDALLQGLSEEDIFIEFLEQVRFMCVEQQLKTSYLTHKTHHDG